MECGNMLPLSKRRRVAALQSGLAALLWFEKRSESPRRGRNRLCAGAGFAQPSRFLSLSAASRATVPSSGKPLSLGVIFLTLYIDLIGFSIFFPLGPELLKYYIAHESAGGVFAALFASLQNLAVATHAPAMALGALFAGLLGSVYAF